MKPKPTLPATGTVDAFVALVVATVAAAAVPDATARKAAAAPAAAALRLNELEYLEMPGLNVMLAHDYYPEGHQGGVGIIQNACGS